MHFQHVVAIAQPFISRFLHGCGRGGLHPFQVVLITVRITPVGLAARDQVTLAAKAADSLHDPGISTENLCLRQLQLGCTGAVLEEILQFFVRSLFHLAKLFPRIRRQSEIELAADLIGVVPRGRDLFAQ